ncbi:hypothetical protein BW14_06865 [Bifidobacterium sp. UTBIF-68]|uniref:hypothetical protein n=1 Tax=Bifidobacterium sp. UTBIF-68 TaxID=1465262 RepID=UPI00112DBABB|nr:hypothetical protein [Bifidobacterium sp. UTBIF-68]TPF92880.1 hypothetical protein BW14_06865 [Bifidobacterium sp. UTBIF-68]
MAADPTQALTVLEQQRQLLVDEFIRRAWNMWKSLDPADWWNDAITQGVGAWITQNQIAFVKAMRRLGVTYADIALGMAGVNAEGQVPEYIVTRANTDPWAVSVRPSDEYRHIAVRNPDIRPEAWGRLDEAAGNAVNIWLDTALNRLTDNANTDGQIAMNSAATKRFQGSGIRKYRRIIHPELSKTGTCGLCVVAANNVYGTADLLPMHNLCKCTVMPITASHDPGLRLNREDLDRIYKKAGGTTNASGLKSVRVEVVNHSEIGPILTQSQWRREYDDGTPAPKWNIPDLNMTRTAFTRMYERANVFLTHYRNVMDTGEEDVFHFEGRAYRFRPSPHLKQAMSYQTAWLNYLRSSLGLAA